jgi:hypothetical protein
VSADSDELISNLIPNLIPSCLDARGFKIALLNIVSLPNHVDELRISKLFLHFDLLALNETRLDSSISDGLVKIRGYDIVRNDRSRRGGGVCIYLRSTINYKIRNDLVPDDIEAICLEISNPNSRNFIVASVYRPPSSTPEFFLTFEKIGTQCVHVACFDQLSKDINFLRSLSFEMRSVNLIRCV